ncbi:hypothetical protein ACFY36_13360 [Actinoplanes sp. NPDC000266]
MAGRQIEVLAARWRRRPARGLEIKPGRPLPANIYAALLLTLASLAAGFFALTLYESGTALPESYFFRGQIFFCVSDPAADVALDVTVTENIDYVGLGDLRSAKGIEILLTIPPGSRVDADSSWALVMMGDAVPASLTRMRFVSGMMNFTGGGGTGNDIETVTTGSFADLQDPFRYYIVSADLPNAMTRSGAGHINVELPVIGGCGPTGSARFDPGFGLPGLWHTSRNGKVTTHLTPLEPDMLLQDSIPEAQKKKMANSENIFELQWSGHQPDGIRATLVDVREQQRAGSRLFAAGALAGVAGGLFVEAILRTGPFTNKPNRRRRASARRRRRR